MSEEPESKKKFEWESVHITPEEVAKLLDERPGGRRPAGEIPPGHRKDTRRNTGSAPDRSTESLDNDFRYSQSIEMSGKKGVTNPQI